MITDKQCAIALIAFAIFLKTLFYFKTLSQSSKREIVQWVEKCRESQNENKMQDFEHNML